jgi:hypothetical protein
MTTRRNQKLHAPQLGLIATDIVLINLGSSDFYQTYLNEGLPTISQVHNDIPDMEGEMNSIFFCLEKVYEESFVIKALA